MSVYIEKTCFWTNESWITGDALSLTFRFMWTFKWLP